MLTNNFLGEKLKSFLTMDFSQHKTSEGSRSLRSQRSKRRSKSCDSRSEFGEDTHLRDDVNLHVPRTMSSVS